MSIEFGFDLVVGQGGLVTRLGESYFVSNPVPVNYEKTTGFAEVRERALHERPEARKQFRTVYSLGRTKKCTPIRVANRGASLTRQSPVIRSAASPSCTQRRVPIQHARGVSGWQERSES